MDVNETRKTKIEFMNSLLTIRFHTACYLALFMYSVNALYAREIQMPDSCSQAGTVVTIPVYLDNAADLASLEIQGILAVRVGLVDPLNRFLRLNSFDCSFFFIK